jgi:hypothetical protein
MADVDPLHDELAGAKRRRDAAVDPVAGPQTAVLAGGLQALAAEVARAVGPDERRHDHVAPGEPADLGADVLDDAEELVADAVAVLDGGLGAVGPQIAAADACAQHPDHRVGRLLDHRAGDLADPYVSGAVDQSRSHDWFAFRPSNV